MPRRTFPVINVGSTPDAIEVLALALWTAPARRKGPEAAGALSATEKIAACVGWQRAGELFV